MTLFEKVTAGEKFVPNAAMHNATVDLLASRSSMSGGLLQFPDHNGTIILVKNNTSSARGRHDVLGIDEPIITPTSNLGEFQNRVMMKCSTPTASHDDYVVLLESIPAGGIGHALISGVCVAKLNIVAATDVTAGLAAGVTTLTTGKPGGRIIWKSTGTGSDNKWGIIRVGGNDGILIGKTDAAHAKGASGTVSIWNGTPGSETDTGDNVDAYNRFANVAISKWVALANNGFGFYLIAAEC